MQFTFQIMPGTKEVSELVKQLQQLVGEISLVFNENETLKLIELHVVPDKLEHGKLYFADGTDWDPGAGRGVYLWDEIGPTWRLLS